MITVKNLKKNFGDLTVLKGIDVTIEKGECVVVIGPSGSGKSTFLRCLNRLEEPDGGEIDIEGTDLLSPHTDINEMRQRIGMVFQHFNLFPHKTILENVTLAPIKLKKMPQKEAEDAALELLRRVGIEDKASVYPSTLSGGQKQRLCIARALLKKPKILILDDSTSAVDTATEAEIRKSFSTSLKDATKLIIAQRISSVEHADRILVMDEGEIVGQGTHEELMKSCEAYQEIYYSQFKKTEDEKEGR